MLKNILLSLVVLHFALSPAKAGISIDPVLTSVLETEPLIENGRVVGELLRFRGGQVIHYTRYLPSRVRVPGGFFGRPNAARLMGLSLLAAYLTTHYMVSWADKEWECAQEQAQVYFASRAQRHFQQIYMKYLREISRLMSEYRARRIPEDQILAWANREKERLFHVALAEADALATQETNAMFNADTYCGSTIDLRTYDTLYYSWWCTWMPPETAINPK